MPGAGSRRQTSRLDAAAAVALACVLCGCASDPFAAAGVEPYRARVELIDTPFFPQEDFQCGPAALATVLRATGTVVRPDELTAKVYVPARRGSLQPEMLAATRAYQRIAYVIAPQFSALLAEVAAGHPVLVLQNLGIAALPRWHYAVVVGFSPEDGDVILRSGLDRRRVTPARVFAKTWQRSGNWGMVVLPPDELPAVAERDRYLSMVASVESAGQLDTARVAYRTALERWPNSRLAWLGLGNIAWSAGRAAEAEQNYRHALALQPVDGVTLNNLATVVAAQGRCAEARQLLQRATAIAPIGSALQEAVAGTQHDVDTCTAH